MLLTDFLVFSASFIPSILAAPQPFLDHSNLHARAATIISGPSPPPNRPIPRPPRIPLQQGVSKGLQYLHTKYADPKLLTVLGRTSKAYWKVNPEWRNPANFEELCLTVEVPSTSMPGMMRKDDWQSEDGGEDWPEKYVPHEYAGEDFFADTTFTLQDLEVEGAKTRDQAVELLKTVEKGIEENIAFYRILMTPKQGPLSTRLPQGVLWYEFSLYPLQQMMHVPKRITDVEHVYVAVSHDTMYVDRASNGIQLFDPSKMPPSPPAPPPIPLSFADNVALGILVQKNAPTVYTEVARLMSIKTTVMQNGGENDASVDNDANSPQSTTGTTTTTMTTTVNPLLQDPHKMMSSENDIQQTYHQDNNPVKYSSIEIKFDVPWFPNTAMIVKSGPEWGTWELQDYFDDEHDRYNGVDWAELQGKMTDKAAMALAVEHGLDEKNVGETSVFANSRNKDMGLPLDTYYAYRVRGAGDGWAGFVYVGVKAEKVYSYLDTKIN